MLIGKQLQWAQDKTDNPHVLLLKNPWSMDLHAVRELCALRAVHPWCNPACRRQGSSSTVTYISHINWQEDQ
jgi:hypothetical protein